ncbi:MAG TPA: DNA repair protein RadC [Acidobacteriota bacterium]
MSIAPQPYRPRERLLTEGPEALAETELLALILGQGVAGQRTLAVAGELIARFGSLRALLGAQPAELRAVRGVGDARAAQMTALSALLRRLQVPPLERRAAVRSSADIAAHFGPLLAAERRESFWAVLLDARHRILRRTRICEGGLTAAVIHPREAFALALREGAAAVLFVHNHPSGDVRPSAEDLALTRRLVQAGELLGIRVLDHVIVGAEGFTSLADLGNL